MELLGALLGPSLKNKKNSPQKNSLYFKKGDFLALILKNFLHLLIFQETKTLKKNPYISGNRNPKKLLIFLEIEFFNPSSKNINIIRPQKIRYILGNFLTLILNPEKMSYIQEKKTLKKFLIFSQMKAVFVF